MMQDEPELSLPSTAARKETWSKAELLDLISRSAGATMAVIDRSLVMIYVNEEYARWFGTAPDRLVGKTLVDVYGEQDCARFMPFVERVLRGERVQYQRMLRTPYGFDEWRTICLTPWHNSQGAIDGFITTALDVHELQVTMNALRTANQRLSSHMENSPLAVLGAVRPPPLEDPLPRSQLAPRLLHRSTSPSTPDRHIVAERPKGVSDQDRSARAIDSDAVPDARPDRRSA